MRRQVVIRLACVSKTLILTTISERSAIPMVLLRKAVNIQAVQPEHTSVTNPKSVRKPF